MRADLEAEILENERLARLDIGERYGRDSGEIGERYGVGVRMSTRGWEI